MALETVAAAEAVVRPVVAEEIVVVVAAEAVEAVPAVPRVERR